MTTGSNSLSASTESEPGSGQAASSLPVALTSFVGRASEITRVRDLLAGTRLLTLTGAGGSGKTRLAQEAVGHAGGALMVEVVWVELAALTRPELVPQQVAATLGLREQGGRPVVEMLVDLIGTRGLLLVLDNCEHLVDACAHLAETLLRGCPSLRILATSREALGVAGEQAWLVPALSLPEAQPSNLEAITSAEAVQLFAERARDVMPEFRLTESNAASVAQICRRLDGIPLAIELAAARVRVLATEQIAARLDDAFRLLSSGSRTALPRHRTLRATIDWSYDLLVEERRILMRRLSVFGGGFTLEAAESVCAGGDLETGDVLDLLAGLVDQSIVTMHEVEGTARYSLLETVRQYAWERQRETGETDAIQARHAAYFAALLAGAEPHFTTPARRRWVELVYRELDNVRRALGWTRENDPHLHLRIAALLCWFWFSTRHWAEGRRVADAALALPEAAAPTRERAGVLFAAGVLASMQAQTPLAIELLEESARIAASLGDRRQEAYALNYLGMALVSRGSPEGRAPAEKAMAWFRETGDLYGLRLSLLVLGLLSLGARDVGRAVQLVEEAVGVARSFGQDRELAIALNVLGEIRLEQRNVPLAEALFREAVVALHRDPLPAFMARSLEMLAVIRIEQGAMAEGLRLFGAAEGIREIVGAAPFKRDQDRYEPRIAAARGALGEEGSGRAWAEGRRMTLDQVIDAVLATPLAEGGGPAPASASEAPTPAAAQAAAVAAVAATASDASVPLAGAPPARGAAAPALRVLALGPLEIELEGQPLPPTAWTYARPRELLVYLLAHPRGRTRDHLALAFWPEASAAQAKNSFHVTLHHLRRVLGRSEWIVFEGDRYRVNAELETEFDAVLFEERISAALRDARAGSPSVERLRDALALYRGDFLSDEVVGDWHLEIRERLQRLYVGGLQVLGDLLMQQERWAEAAEVYQQVVRKEDLHEEAHRRLMLCWSQAGERGRALKHYERLVVLLEAELDAEPEAETTALFERLRG
jgi:predicted ATPase/DNA-binding SARP family transcriptional activator